MEAADAGALTLRAALLQCAAFTWLNPHVYLDTVVLVGGISTTFGDNRWWYALGAVTALLRLVLCAGLWRAAVDAAFPRKPAAWRVLDTGHRLRPWLAGREDSDGGALTQGHEA